MDIAKMLLLQFLAFASGIVISGGVFAFIATIGLVPRFAKRTGTEKYIKRYESSIIIGGVFGSSTMVFSYYIPIGSFLVVAVALAIGIFVGCMAVSLAEILDVIPVLTRRAKIAFGLPFFILSIAIGKLVGSFIYYIIPGFYSF